MDALEITIDGHTSTHRSVQGRHPEPSTSILILIAYRRGNLRACAVLGGLEQGCASDDRPVSRHCDARQAPAGVRVGPALVDDKSGRIRTGWWMLGPSSGAMGDEERQGRQGREDLVN